MTTLAFGMSTPRDFLEKARREVARLEQASGSIFGDYNDVMDTAINAAITLWQLRDWVARSPDAAEAIQRIRMESQSTKTTAENILGEHVLQRPEIAICHKIATGAKHCLEVTEVRGPGSLFKKHVRLVSAFEQPEEAAPLPLFGRSGNFPNVEDTAVSATGAFTSSFGRRYTAKIVFDDGARQPAHVVFKAALDYWDQVFQRYGLA